MKYNVFFIIVPLALLLGYFAWFDALPKWDETVYMTNARSHVADIKPLEDYRSPLLEYVIAGIWLVTWESLAAARSLAIAFTLLLVYLFYLICREYFDSQLSFWLTMLFSASPLIITWGYTAYSDIPGLCLIALAFYFIIKDNYTAAGFFSGAAFLMRFPYGLFAAAVLLYVLLEYKFTRQMAERIFQYASTFAIILVPWLLYNWLHYNNLSWDFRIYQSVIRNYSLNEPIALFMTRAFWLLIILPAFMLLGLAQVRKRPKGYGLIVISLAVILGYYLFFVNLKIERYFLSWILFFYLLVGFGFLWIKINYRKLAMPALVLALVMAAYTLVPAVAAVQNDIRCKADGALMQSVLYLQQRVNPASRILSNTWVYYQYYLGTESYSLWSPHVGALISQYSPKYVIINNQEGELFDTSLAEQSGRVYIEQEFRDDCGQRVTLYRVK
ncbi:glycosyltransferase family 39 protein [Candidatus Woesearchaeota archaeon]|nr:glycosyltransferase family 39 protein [Candidatus Woesearchaeota archaeon]